MPRASPGSSARAGTNLFWGRPTPVGIEPLSMTAVSCASAADRKAETWGARIKPFPRPEFAAADAAKGIAAAVEQVAEGRRGSTSAPALGHGLDLLHTAEEARAVLARRWREAEAADAEVDRAQGRGIDARGPARAAWRVATAALERVGRLEEAWRWARAAPELFRPGGRLNDRARRGRDRRGGGGAARSGVEDGPQLPPGPTKSRLSRPDARAPRLRMTQPMLDLERLFGNSHPRRSGPRKDVYPYRSPGLGLPTFDFWELLQADPAELTQELSNQGNTT